MSADVVSFYLPGRRALRGLEVTEIDPDRDWELFGTGAYVWILQTFVRLRRAGANVQLEEAPPARGLVVVHADDVEQLLAGHSSRSELIVTSVRADRRPQILADFELVQNARSAGANRIFIPSWRQPGLIPRDPVRGTCVERIAYIGSRRELHDELASPGWAEVLGATGLVWDPRVVTFARNDQLYSEHPWNDYSAVDVVVALRPREAWPASSKPAAKLQNAWSAGAPAILSPEIPYRELRESDLDYLEARSDRDVVQAIGRLRADPGLYAAMVRNRLERAREFEPDQLIARWSEVLWREVPSRAARSSHRFLAKGRRYRAVVRGARRSWRPFRPSS